MELEVQENPNYICKYERKEKEKEDLFIYYSSKEMEIKLSEKIADIFNLELSLFKYIGRGGGSFIYEAEIKGRKKSLIIKVISEEKYKNSNEIEIMVKLRHPNIISLFGYYTAKNTEQFIIMENGKMDLKYWQYNLLKRAFLSETFLCYIAFQILEGLKYLNRCSIIHYDIKPNNIVMDEALNIKIIDFSTSVDMSLIKESHVKLKYRGTALYMAPEVINREKIEIKNFHKIDLFSLGVMLYRLAFGYYPYDLQREDADNDDIIYQKITSEWKAENNETEFSSHFINFLNCLLEKDIDKRISINEALDHYWIQGAKIIMEEKENIYNANAFLTSLMTDYLHKFNEYIFF